jgi:uncharacterized protein YjiS (DUF1127 family)
MTRSFDERGAAPSLAAIHPGSPGVFAALNRFVLQPLVTLHRHRVARRELMALDDRQLADIGLHRSQIELALTAPNRVVSPFSSEPRPVNANRTTAHRTA